MRLIRNPASLTKRGKKDGKGRVGQADWKGKSGTVERIKWGVTKEDDWEEREIKLGDENPAKGQGKGEK